AAPGERQQARRLAAQDLAAHRAGVADLAVLLRGWIVPARQFRIAEMQLHGTARARVHRSAGEPEAALVRIDEVAPAAFERTGQASAEAQGAGAGEGAVGGHGVGPPRVGGASGGLPDPSWPAPRSSASRLFRRAVENFAKPCSHASASAWGAAWSAQRWVWPCSVRRSRPARSRGRMCLEAAASDISDGAASSPSLRSPGASAASIARRVGSERAWKTPSRRGGYSIMWLNICLWTALVNPEVE